MFFKIKSCWINNFKIPFTEKSSIWADAHFSVVWLANTRCLLLYHKLNLFVYVDPPQAPDLPSSLICKWDSSELREQTWDQTWSVLEVSVENIKSVLSFFFGILFFSILQHSKFAFSCEQRVFLRKCNPENTEEPWAVSSSFGNILLEKKKKKETGGSAQRNLLPWAQCWE